MNDATEWEVMDATRDVSALMDAAALVGVSITDEAQKTLEFDPADGFWVEERFL